MKKIAIVVQRGGKDIVGGSEGYAYQMANILSAVFKVDILTTTAKDHISWNNHYPEGVEVQNENFNIVRFNNDFIRDDYWLRLNGALEKETNLLVYAILSEEEKTVHREKFSRVSFGYATHWIKREGPYSSKLLNFIKENNKSYDTFIFMTYLYPTTYFGVDMVENKKKIFFIPTYHDELPAYLPIFQKYRKYNHLFLTRSEQKTAEELIYKKRVDGQIVGFGMKDKVGQGDIGKSDGKYVLYAGRLEETKGVQRLYDFFCRYVDEEKSEIRLYTIGDGHLKNFKHRAVEYKGFVSEEEKLSLMKDALLFIHPSAFESLGIVLLESFMMGTPALVNGECEVLAEHIEDSKAGFSYWNYDEFKLYLNEALNGKESYMIKSENARKYFENNYSLEEYKRKLLEYLEN